MVHSLNGYVRGVKFHRSNLRQHPSWEWIEQEEIDTSSVSSLCHTDVAPSLKFMQIPIQIDSNLY